jgi:hypothetical protein
MRQVMSSCCGGKATKSKPIAVRKIVPSGSLDIWAFREGKALKPAFSLANLSASKLREIIDSSFDRNLGSGG